MKDQALFSPKDKSKKKEIVLSAAILLGFSRVNVHNCRVTMIRERLLSQVWEGQGI